MIECSKYGTLNLYTRPWKGDYSVSSRIQLLPETAATELWGRLNYVITQDSKETVYRIYGEHNVTRGTSDLTAGSSALNTGCIYLVYE